MATEVIMPQLGADMKEGRLVRWVKREGDAVEVGEPIAEIETDKAVVQLESPAGGVLAAISVQEGEVVPVGRVLAYILSKGEAVPVAAPAIRDGPPPDRITPREPTMASAPAKSTAAGSIAPSRDKERGARLRASPLARRIAEQHGIDLAALRGTGPDGRILRSDVEAAISVAPPAAPPSSVGPKPLSKMRGAIARRMTLSKMTAPHYYLTMNVDMTAAMEFRARLNEVADERSRVTVNDLIVKACALALGRHPAFNASWGEEGVTFHEAVHVNVGIALETGLIAPAVLGCESKSLGEIARATKHLAERARGGALAPAELTEGTFTVTNLGAYGVEALIGIINPPQAAILGVGAATKKPVVRADSIVIREVMKIALSADHRITDGAQGALFLQEIRKVLEAPETLAL